MARNKCCAGDV